MIRVKNKCGIYQFEFEDSYEVDHLRLVVGEMINGIPYLQYKLMQEVKYSIAGNSILNQNSSIFRLLKPLPIATKTFCGDLVNILERNNLIFNIETNKIVLAKSIVGRQINMQDKVLGLLQNNNIIKSYNGFFDIDNNLTIVKDYETY